MKKTLKNNKGFTLVELLAVIVILAVVMLIGVTAVGPLMNRARKGALGSEGLSMIDAAKTAYEAEQMGVGTTIKNNSDVCFDLAFLYNAGYFEKGSGTGTNGDGYLGSVYIDATDETTGNITYSYRFWITNSTYKFTNITSTSYNSTSATSYIESDATEISYCGFEKFTANDDADSEETGTDIYCYMVSGTPSCKVGTFK